MMENRPNGQTKGNVPQPIRSDGAGDVGYVPFATGHYIRNTGTETLWFLEMFKSDRFADVSLNQWMALTPKELVQSNLNVGSELLDSLHEEKWPVVKYPGFSYYPKKD